MDFSKENRLHLLIDFCEMGVFITHPKIFGAMMRLSRIMKDCLTVIIVVSSGEGSNLEQPHIYNAFQRLIKSTPEQMVFSGFTENEAKAFLFLNNVKKNFETLKPYTGTNPLLLCHVVSDTLDCPYKSTIQTTIEKFVSNNLKLYESNTPQAVMLLNSLTNCKKYFEYSIGKIALNDQDIDDYASTWCRKQRIMSLKEDCTLILNFPTLLPVMYRVLESILNNTPNIVRRFVKKKTCFV